MKNLNVTIIQTALHWEDVEANLSLFSEYIDGLTQYTDIIVIPEMFTTGFTMNPEPFSRGLAVKTIDWLRKKSAQTGADIVGSIIVQDSGRYFNRLVWIKPEGNFHTYDKRHLFRMTGEHKIYHAGNQTVTVALHGWKIRPFICYDLRFPKWTRNIENQYDMAIFVANWPESRSTHWKILLQARAVENQCYVVGVNRIGADGNGLRYHGDSCIVDPFGNMLFQKSKEFCVHTQSLSYVFLTRYRASFPVWMDADRE